MLLMWLLHKLPLCFGIIGMDGGESERFEGKMRRKLLLLLVVLLVVDGCELRVVVEGKVVFCWLLLLWWWWLRWERAEEKLMQRKLYA